MTFLDDVVNLLAMILAVNVALAVMVGAGVVTLMVHTWRSWDRSSDNGRFRRVDLR